MIKKVTMEEFEGLGRKRYNTSITRDIEEFIQSNEPVCEVNICGYKRIQSAANAYRASARKSKYGITVVQRSGRLFLVRDKVGEDDA